MSPKTLTRSAKILVLVVAPWFTTGCGLVQALGSLLGGSAGGLAGATKIGSPSTAAAAAAKNTVVPAKLQTDALLTSGAVAKGSGKTPVQPNLLAFIERVPATDRT